MILINGHFYFVKDAFYEALADCKLMANKGNDIERGGRPCHYCFKEMNYYWMVPISSQIEKFHEIYNKKVEKRGYCDGIRFGYVNGNERAFLIQNCFPITEIYIDEEYKINNNSVSVTISEKFSKELNGLIRKVIRLYNKGINMPLTNLEKIINFLNENSI